MKRYEAESIGNLLRQAIEDSLTAPKLDEISAVKAWPLVIGAELATKTRKPFIRNGVMSIGVPSAPLRQELNMMRGTIARAINTHVGKDVVKELKFTG